MSMQQMPPRKSILRGGAWTLGCRVGLVVFHFLLALVLARMLSNEEMGRYFVAMSLAAFLGLMTQLGLSGLAVREVGQRLASNNEHIARVTAWTLLDACASAALVLVLASFFAALCATIFIGAVSHEDVAMVLLTTLLAGSIGLQSIASEILRGYQRIGPAAWSGGVLTYLIACLIVIIAFHLHWRLSTIQALTVIFVASLVNLIFVARLLPPRPAECTGSIVSWIARGRPFLVNSLATFLFLQADLWVAAIVLPLPEVAIYGAASRLVQPLAFPIEAAESALPPIIVRLINAKRLPELQRILKHAAMVQTMLVGLAVLGLALCAAPLLGLLFGPVYSEGKIITIILAAGWLIRASMGAYGYALMMTSHAHRMAHMTLIWSIFCLPIEWAAGVLWGSIGIAAAAATMLAAFSIAGSRLVLSALGVDITAFANTAVLAISKEKSS